MILDTQLHLISWSMFHFLWQGVLTGAATNLAMFGTRRTQGTRLLPHLERLKDAGEFQRASGWFAPLTMLMICGLSVALFALAADAQSQLESRTELGDENGDRVELNRDLIDKQTGQAVGGIKHSTEIRSLVENDLRVALQADPTFSANDTSYHPQHKAIAAWRNFVKRDDLDQGQQIFAWWRIGSLAAYNFSPDNDEQSDPRLAEQALSNVIELAGGRISRETLNAATVYGGIEGPPDARADRLATAFRWLFTRTDAMLKDSATRINQNGYGITSDLTQGGMRLDSNAKKHQFLTSQLAERRKIITRRITEEIRRSQSPDSIQNLLRSINDVADHSQLETWQVVQHHSFP